ncbi:SWI/SNF complex component SNF12 [Cinnamomum micranthum f. kanehirae]|uniref:SWI/SNF complex component SNF12 n=1 Tax=Cinnamomum micranthum f. kanehirae TaxID=337451 RepID=A0A3S3QN81_9MAGN|nr:SWI/SNF complex component SNF12 [Cinnamomum micranthum f. kanehirae]
MRESSRSCAHHEGFEIKRKGDKKLDVSVRLEMNHVPEKFKLLPTLMDVLGTEVDTCMRIATAIWHYVKKISPHLSLPRAIHYEHRIRLPGSNPAGNACYDFLVDEPLLLQREMSAFFASTLGTKRLMLVMRQFRLKLAAGEGQNAERERHSDFYKQPWVEDAVIRCLNLNPAAGNDAPAST